MKKIILTAVDNNDEVYFKQLIPFLLSLQETNYQDDIGVIGYGLSEEKMTVLEENNILVFDIHSRKYETLYIDRQWMAAYIAEQYHYDLIALYDADIWFPCETFTLFDEIKNTENLYCAYDPAYGDFTEECVTTDYREVIKGKINTYLSHHKMPWQVGVIAGHRNAWLNYRNYIEDKLQEHHIYTQVYGIDTLLVCLYSLESNKVSELSMIYNCLPHCAGLLYSNLTSKGEVQKYASFTIEDKPVQSLHIVKTFRQYGKSLYDYISNYIFNYTIKGRRFIIDKHPYKEIDVRSLDFLPKNKKENCLKITSLYSEHSIEFRVDDECYFLDFQCNAQIHFINETDKPISFYYGVEQIFNHALPAALFVVYNDKPIIINQIQKWHPATLYPKDTLILGSKDLDSRTKMTWRLKDVELTI